MASDKFELKALLIAVDKISPVLKSVQRSVKATSKSIRDVGSAGSDLASKLGVPQAMLGGAFVAGLAKSVSGFMTYGSAVNDTSAKLGINAEKLQEFEYAAKLAGAAPETLHSSLAKLNKNLGDAAVGKNKELVSMLRHLGVSLRDANGKVRNAADIFPELSDAFKKNESPAKRAMMAVAAFGRSGQDLIPMLSGGSEKLAELATEARSLGIVLATNKQDELNQVKAADDLGDTFDKLKLSVQGLGLSIGSFLAPIIEPIMRDMTKWISNNRELVASVSGVALAIIALVAALAGIREIGGAIFRLIPSLYASAKAFGAFMIANPILTSVAVAVGLVAYAAYKIYQNWEPIVNWFANLWESIKGIFSSGIQYLTDAFLNWTPIGLIIKNWEPIVNWFANLWERIRAFIEPITRGVSSFADALGAQSFNGSVTYQGIANDQGTNTEFSNRRLSLSQTGALMGASGQTKLNGEMVVRFEGAPPGMRVEQGRTNNPGMSFNPDVGYRSSALGVA